jgi:hypothetical protein
MVKSKDCLRMRIVGIANLLFAVIGLGQLLWNIIGYVHLPVSFLDQYGSFARGRFKVMSIATIVLLVPLAYAGVGLVKRKRNFIVLSNIVFGAELVFFVGLFVTWNFALAPLTPSVIKLGLFNIGFALQVVTIFPVMGLFILNRHFLLRWRKPSE